MAARGRVYAEGNILMSFETTTDIADVNAPYGKELKFQNVGFEGGMQLIRMRIKEGKRFTTLDLDPATASQVAAIFSQWASEEN